MGFTKSTVFFYREALFFMRTWRNCTLTINTLTYVYLEINAHNLVLAARSANFWCGSQPVEGFFRTETSYALLCLHCLSNGTSGLLP